MPAEGDTVCGVQSGRPRATSPPVTDDLRRAAGTSGSAVAVQLSGQRDSFGHARLGGVGAYLAREIEARTGKEARTTVLGYVQRGGTPTARDRWLATRLGLHAIDAVHQGRWGTMTALRGTDIVTVTLAGATTVLKVVDPALYAEAQVFFG